MRPVKPGRPTPVKKWTVKQYLVVPPDSRLKARGGKGRDGMGGVRSRDGSGEEQTGREGEGGEGLINVSA